MNRLFKFWLVYGEFFLAYNMYDEMLVRLLHKINYCLMDILCSLSFCFLLNLTKFCIKLGLD